MGVRARVSKTSASKRVVHDRRQGREVHYSAEPKALAPLIDWMISSVGWANE